MTFFKNLMIIFVLLLLLALYVFLKVMTNVWSRQSEPPRTVQGHWRRLPNKQRKGIWIDEREQSARERRRGW